MSWTGHRRAVRHTTTTRRVAAAAVALAALVGGCTSKGTVNERAAGTPSPDTTSTGPDGGGVFGRIPDVVRQVEPSVVTIFAGNGLGSGVVYSRDGLVVTNEHVVRGADGGRVEVAFADGQRVRGQVRASDGLTDLAIVAVDRQGLPPAQFRTELPRVGELAVALGSPLGFENSATAGIISGLNRSIPASGRQSQSLVDLIQTDAPISPGNSGGALVDAQGRVVGISEAYIPPQAGAVSLGFAIPAATAVDVVDQLRKNGRARYAFLGVQVAPLTPEIASQLGVDRADGVVVLEVVANGPTARAGIEPGDVIVKLGDTPTPTVGDFLGELRRRSPGDRVRLEVLRGGQTRTVEVTVTDRPG